MRIAISQPTYLPWVGYFDLIDQVDCFVSLDTVQFEKRSWQQRNRIKVPTGLSYLTVPVVVKGRFDQSVAEVEIAEPEFWKTHLRSIEVNYRRAEHFENYYQSFSDALRGENSGSSLAEVNLRMIRWFCSHFGIQKQICRSSDLGQFGRRSELLVNLCRSLGADYYLSPLGSAVYLCDDLEQFSAAGVKVGFQHYEHPEYCQLFPPFAPFASALDLLFNEGPRSMEIIRSGRKLPYSSAEVSQAAIGVRDE